MTMILNVPTDDLRCDLIPHGAYEIPIFPNLYFPPLLQIRPANPFAIFGPPNQMVLRIINSMSCAFQCHAGSVSRSLKQTKTFQPCLDIESSQGCANSSPLTERGILRKF